MDKIKNKWDFLIQCRPNVREMVGTTKLIGGIIRYGENHDLIFHFLTLKDTFTYNEVTEEFKRKLEIR